MRRGRPHLQAQRKAAGFTQESLSYALGNDRTTVARWECGLTEPEAWIRPKLARLLGVTAARLTQLLVLEPSTSPGAGHVRHGSGRLDPASVQALAAEVAVIAERYETEPSAALVAEAGRCHTSAIYLLAQGGTGSTRRRAHQTATTSASLLSQLIWDASGRRDGLAATTYCDAAIGHAAECGDTVAMAHAELRKAYVHLYGLEARNPRAGLAGAQTAALHSEPVSHALHGLAQLHVAEAFAMLGEYRQCERALSFAETAFGKVQPDDVAADAFSPAQFGRLAGSCYLSLGHPERAERFLTETVDLLHDRQKTRSLVLGNLALSQIRRRQLDAAGATLHQAIDLLERSRGGGGMSVVFGAARELYPWRNTPAVQDVHDRLLGLMVRA